VAHRAQKRAVCRVLWENVNEREHLQDIDVDEIKILNRI
jgi:hypothetical protein